MAGASPATMTIDKIANDINGYLLSRFDKSAKTEQVSFYVGNHIMNNSIGHVATVANKYVIEGCIN